MKRFQLRRQIGQCLIDGGDENARRQARASGRFYGRSLNNEFSSVRHRKLSVSSRLYLNPRNKLEIMRQEIPVTECIPKVVERLFPRIVDRRIVEEKIPHVAALADSLYYSRGRLGEKIMREKEARYTIDDEWNLRRIPNSPYDALHDPNLARYLNRPSIREHLVKQKLLRDEENVVCSLKNFNEFRKYLGVVQNSRLDEMLRQASQRETGQLIELRELRANQGGKKEAIKNAIEQAIQRRDQNLFDKRQQYNASLQRSELRLEQARKIKGILRNELLQSQLCREYRRQKAYCKNRNLNKLERKALFNSIVQKELEAELRLAGIALFRKAYNHTRKLYAAGRQITNQRKELRTLATIQETVSKQIKERAEAYNDHMKRRWAHLPDLILERRAEKARLLALARKYFHIWLRKTREAIARRKLAEDGHMSSWNVVMGLDRMNDGLCGAENRIKIVDMRTLIMAAKRDAEFHEKHPDARKLSGGSKKLSLQPGGSSTSMPRRLKKSNENTIQ